MSTPIPEFTTAGKRKTTLKKDLAPFKIDGELFHMKRPKKAHLANMAMALESGAPLDDPRNMKILLSFAGQMIRWVVEAPADAKGGLHGRALLEERLEDEDDSLDIDDLVPIVQQLLSGWFGRPTGSPRGSTPQRRPASAGRGSRARTPSTRARS